MYFNLEMIEARGMTLDDVVLLQLIKQNKTETEIASRYIETWDALKIPFLEEHGLVEYVKPKNKKQGRYDLIRLSKKGAQYLEEFGTVGIIEDDIRIWDWLVKVYKDKGKEIGNKKRGLESLAKFRAESGINRNRLAELCKHFLHDEQQQEYSKVLEYVFWKAPNVYSVRFQLEDSKLWKYYQKNKDYFDNRVFPNTKD